MTLLIVAGILIYAGVAFAFFSISAMELAETGRANFVTIATAFFAALFWPLTTLVLSLTVAIARRHHP